MQQLFSTRNISVRDFEEWHDRGELVLAPKFQRREVWSPMARSFLMDTILRGKPIPKLYMRQDVNPKTRRTTREIVDGQQRLQTVLTFIKDAFRVSKTHNEEHGGRYFSSLGSSVQIDILKYEFVVDLLQDIPDNEVYDIFARLNTYSEKLKPQELRNAKWFGEFKTSVYQLTKEFVGFLEKSKVFTPKQILRMAEAEFISELLLAMHEGIREGKKAVIDKAYKDYDKQFPDRKMYEKRFRETMDTVGAIMDDGLAGLRFRSTRLFYPLYCAIYHMKFGLPHLDVQRISVRPTAYPKLRAALEEISELVERYESNDEVEFSAEEGKFIDAYDEHWVHADKRTTMTAFVCDRLASALK